MEFYLSKENNYESDYSLLLLRLSYRIILQYEENSAWFREKKKEIAKLLMEISEVVCRLDKAKDYYAKDDIDKIKIYTYKFNEYCGNEWTVRKKWPTDLEQRQGRLERQGNMFPEVEVYHYVTEQTFDAYLFVRHEVA